MPERALTSASPPISRHFSGPTVNQRVEVFIRCPSSAPLVALFLSSACSSSVRRLRGASPASVTRDMTWLLRSMDPSLRANAARSGKVEVYLLVKGSTIAELKVAWLEKPVHVRGEQKESPLGLLQRFASAMAATAAIRCCRLRPPLDW